MNRTTPPAAPAFEDLPPRRSPAAGVRKDFAVSLEIVTPILGGGYRARAPDNVDLTNNTRIIHYDLSRADGLPIATGVIEGACRYLVQDRMGRTGAVWSTAVPEAVLRLRALRTSGGFDDYWQFHLANEHQRTHKSRYAHDDVSNPLPPSRPRLRLVKGSKLLPPRRVVKEPHTFLFPRHRARGLAVRPRRVPLASCDAHRDEAYRDQKCR